MLIIYHPAAHEIRRREPWNSRCNWGQKLPPRITCGCDCPHVPSDHSAFEASVPDTEVIRVRIFEPAVGQSKAPQGLAELQKVLETSATPAFRRFAARLAFTYLRLAVTLPSCKNATSLRNPPEERALA